MTLKRKSWRHDMDTWRWRHNNYSDVIMGIAIVYSTVYSGADQRKHQTSAPLAFVRGIHRWPVNSPRKWPVTRKIFPFDDVIMDKGRWRHNIKRLSALISLCEWSRLLMDSPHKTTGHWWMDSPHKGPLMQSYAVFVDVETIAGDFKRHEFHLTSL